LYLRREVADEGGPHAAWTPALEQNYGVTQKAFQDMGLGMLTNDQEIDVLV
jgi:hypothetical protein